jgi:hypothetical protein
VVSVSRMLAAMTTRRVDLDDELEGGDFED